MSCFSQKKPQAAPFWFTRTPLPGARTGPLASLSLIDPCFDLQDQMTLKINCDFQDREGHVPKEEVGAKEHSWPRLPIPLFHLCQDASQGGSSSQKPRTGTFSGRQTKRIVSRKSQDLSVFVKHLSVTSTAVGWNCLSPPLAEQWRRKREPYAPFRGWMVPRQLLLQTLSPPGWNQDGHHLFWRLLYRE